MVKLSFPVMLTVSGKRVRETEFAGYISACVCVKAAFVHVECMCDSVCVKVLLCPDADCFCNAVSQFCFLYGKER